VNPLVVTKQGNVVALDGKVTFDDNALFRHPDIAAMLDPTEEDPSEIEAKSHDMAFVKLGGNIGCMVNGAGLAMATMDIIKLYGGEPANFLDVGGGASQEQVTQAFRMILSSKEVKGIFVNIFGGIMRCDVIANGIVAASKELGQGALVVRLENLRDEGRKLLDESGLKIKAHRRWVTARRRSSLRSAQCAPSWRRGLRKTMSILVDKNTKVVFQGITGESGSLHAKACLAYGTQIVAGVTPGRGGQTFEGKVPVFDTVEDAVKQTGAEVSCIFVPPVGAADAICEAAVAGVRLVVCITDGVPVLDMVKVRDFLARTNTKLIRRTVQRDHPGEVKFTRRLQDRHHAGLHPQARPRRHRLAQRHADLRGGVAGDQRRHGAIDLHRHRRRPVGGLDSRLFGPLQQGPHTEGLILIGEIGGNAEQRAAAWIKENMKKPVCAFIAGRTAPPGKRMGHAGAIIAGGKGTAAEKIAAFEAAGVKVAPSPAEMGTTLKSLLK
jgi:succinyl-CoA synthetase alpha subunit